MIEYTVTVDAPHAELGAQKREFISRSATAVVNFILGLTHDHPDTPLTFNVIAATVHE